MNSSFRTVFLHEHVTGGGFAGGELPPSLAAEGNAMRRALARDFATLERTRVVVTLDSRLADEPGPWSVVRVSQDEEISTFSRLAAECDFTLLVAPETDRILLARAQIIDQVKGRSLGSIPSAIALAGDKLALADHWNLLGIPTPSLRLVDPRQGLPRDATYPAILKPRLGAGCLETFVVESFNDFKDNIICTDQYLMQEYVFGESFSASFLIAPSGRAKLIGVAAQNIVREGSTLHYRGGQVPIEVEADCVSIARRAVESVAGLRGWIGVDFIRDPDSGRISILEINPRATTSLVGWQRVLGAGRIAESWIDMFDYFVYNNINVNSKKTFRFDSDGTIHDQEDH